MNVVYASNDNYARHLGVSICSLFDSNTREKKIDVYILSVGISDENRKKLDSIGDRYRRNIHYIEISDLKEKIPFSVDTGRFDISTLGRLFIGEMLPETVKKILYLDCDTVVIRSLKNMWALDLEGNIAGAVQEPTIYKEVKADIGLGENDPYYNAGVLLVDMEKWREEDTGRRMMVYYEEMAAIEAEEKKAREDREEREREREKEQEKEQEKPRGWRAYFPRRKKKQAEAVHEDKQEAATEQLEAESAMNQAQPEDKTEEAVSEEPYQESEEYQEPKEYQEAEEHQELEEYQEAEEYQESEPYQEEEQAYEEYVEENQQDMEEEFADTAQDWEAPEEENVGDINPYTGMEYESNSVRMHPKRIGYVQVYDRSDHQWTDMTEWAFLGYQERKKALLGKDYEPPIYLD